MQVKGGEGAFACFVDKKRRDTRSLERFELVSGRKIYVEGLNVYKIVLFGQSK